MLIERVVTCGEDVFRQWNTQGSLPATTYPRHAVIPFQSITQQQYNSFLVKAYHGIADHALQEHLEDTTGLLVDESRDTLDTATTSETTDSGLCDT